MTCIEYLCSAFQKRISLIRNLHKTRHRPLLYSAIIKRWQVSEACWSTKKCLIYISCFTNTHTFALSRDKMWDFDKPGWMRTMTRQFYNALISDFLLQITNTSGNNMSIDTENGSGLLTLPSCICNKNNKRCQKKKVLCIKATWFNRNVSLLMVKTTMLIDRLIDWLIDSFIISSISV